MRRQIAGPVLIGLQIALTMAIVCNALFIITHRISHISRPTGLQESDLFWVSQQWVGAPSADTAGGADQLDAMQAEDLAVLRRTANVDSATAISTLPLLNSSRDGSIALHPDQKNGNTRTVFYFGDENMIATLGLHVVAGRAFGPGDIAHQAARSKYEPSMVIITRAEASKLFPQGDALGKAIYLNGGSHPAVIIGIVEQLQVSTTHSWASNFAYNSTLVPLRLDDIVSTYAVRAKPGRLQEAMKAVPAALYESRPARVMDGRSVRSFADIRAEAYRADLGLAILMGTVCLTLVLVTAAGIVGLNTFWVSQRRKQIGIRRVLGARKIDIFGHFQVENLLICSSGAVIGIGLAEALNLWLLQHYEMDRIPVVYVLIGFILVVILGQLAVFAPARRASNTSPMAAIRAM
jgi:putative ABC transport system permease protein